MTAYYNDNDPYVAQWLRNLIAAGHLPPGDVDERDIRDVSADDLRGYHQVHMFSGIGGWPYALQLAGWGDRPVWTASCPCPPFSQAGKRRKCPACQSYLLVWCPRRTGFAICAACSHAWLADPRHLWPEVWRLAAERRPERILGEQVAGVGGTDWLAGVRGSLEILGYAVGAPDLPACSVGAPHSRQRLWWLAHSNSSTGRQGRPFDGRWHQRSDALEGAGLGGGGNTGRLGNASGPRTGRDGRTTLGAKAQGGSEGRQDGRQDGRGGDQPVPSGPWNDYDLIPCADGKARRVKSGLQPLATGVSGRVGKLRAAGNAIVPQVAAEFVRCSQEALSL